MLDGQILSWKFIVSAGIVVLFEVTRLFDLTLILISGATLFANIFSKLFLIFLLWLFNLLKKILIVVLIRVIAPYNDRFLFAPDTDDKFVVGIKLNGGHFIGMSFVFVEEGEIDAREIEKFDF